MGATRTRALDLRPATVAVAALVIVAAALRFSRIGHQGFWFDEANSSADMQYSLGKMLGLLPQNETTPPLYYLLGWVWGRAVGFAEAPLRSLSALAGVAAVPVVYLAGARLISRRAGLIAAALTACNPLLIWYSQEARPYELLVLLSAASLVAFAGVLRRPTARSVAAWLIVCALAIADHYYALLVVVPQALWLLAVYRGRRSIITAVAVIGAIGLGLLPLAIAQNHTGNASWIAPIPLAPRLRAVVPQFLVGFQAPVYGLLLRVAEAVVVLSVVLLARRSDPWERRRAIAIGALAASGFVLNLAMIAAGIDDLITRNLIALWVPAALFVAGGLGARRAGAAGIAAAAVLCTTGVVAAAGVSQDRSFQRPDWRGVARVLGARPAPGVTRAILVQHYKYLLPLSLYVHGLRMWPRRDGRPAGMVRVSELDVISFSAPHVPLCWWGAACNLDGSRMQRSYPVPGMRERSVRHVYQFTVMRLAAPRPVALTPALVARALTTTTLARDELMWQR